MQLLFLKNIAPQEIQNGSPRAMSSRLLWSFYLCIFVKQKGIKHKKPEPEVKW